MQQGDYILMSSLQSYAGILWIGDPHASSTSIGRRKDDYESSVLAKLNECADISNKFNLLPLIAGDLFHKADENSVHLLTNLIRTFKRFTIKPRSLEGNHDRYTTELSDDDALMLLSESGWLQLYSTFGLAESVIINGKVVNIWACPYGFELPNSIPVSQGETNIMLTHHDMAFESAYPGALPLFEIKGCSMVLNGHMHDRKPSVSKGETIWHNRGNIEPVSVDLIDHIPAVWEWDGAEDFSLKEHTLTHSRDVFDLTGLVIKAADASESVDAIMPKDGANQEGSVNSDATPIASVSVLESSFVKALESDQALDADKTEDAEIIKKDLAEVLEIIEASEGTKKLLTLLAGTL